MKDGRVLHEGLRHGVARVVWRTVVLVLRVRRVVVGERRRIALLGTLTGTGLALAARLRRRRVLLS